MNYLGLTEQPLLVQLIAAASGGILLMSRDVHAGEHLKDLLVGQILWVSTNQLIAALSALWQWSNLKTRNLGFYALFALAVTASVQLVGVYLVFASLIIPALTTYRVSHRRTHYAFAVGITGYAIGLCPHGLICRAAQRLYGRWQERAFSRHGC